MLVIKGSVLLLMGLTVLLFVACGGGEDRQGGAPTTIETAPAAAISASEAMGHIGSRKTVCGAVKSPTYARSSRGQPTFLNLDRPYPNQIFTVVIWGSNRGNFPQGPESLYRDKKICATGLIESFKGVPQIEATSSSQIQITR